MSNNDLTSPDLLSIAKEILKNRPLDPDGIHGITHWGRVLENAERLAAMTGANLQVVRLFALFHDSRRWNDSHDPEHGARGAVLAGEMNGTLFTLSPSELALLQDACTRHTRGFTRSRHHGSDLLGWRPPGSAPCLHHSCT